MKVTQPHQPQPSTTHRDDTNVIVLPRPGCRVTPSALAQARNTLRTAPRHLPRLHGTRAWRTSLRVASAHATLTAAGRAA